MSEEEARRVLGLTYADDAWAEYRAAVAAGEMHIGLDVVAFYYRQVHRARAVLGLDWVNAPPVRYSGPKA